MASWIFAIASASGQAKLNKYGYPEKHAPQPTSQAITPGDLETRLYIFADDSMMGRETGTRGHLISTAYIADELRRLGLTPAGDNGTYFQNVPMIRRAFNEKSTITVDGVPLNALDVHKWRSQTAVVFQNFTRFWASAADNVRHARRIVRPGDRPPIDDLLDAVTLTPAEQHTPVEDLPPSRQQFAAGELT